MLDRPLHRDIQVSADGEGDTVVFAIIENLCLVRGAVCAKVGDTLALGHLRDAVLEELKVAREMQLKLLPKNIPDIHKNMRIEAVSIPAYEVGGDYYDFVQLDDHRWGFYIGDVSGKSTSAAFYMAEIKGIIQSLSRLYHSPKELLIQVNSTLYGNIDRKSFISLLAAVVDTKKKTLTFTRAGHCPLGYYSPSKNDWEFLQPKGIGLGLDKGSIFDRVLEEKTIDLEPGSVCFLYTDGVTEVFNSTGDEFGETRLLQSLNTAREQNIQEYHKQVLKELRAFSDNTTTDDITMIALHFEKREDEEE